MIRKRKARQTDRDKVNSTRNGESWVGYALCAMALAVPFLYWGNLLNGSVLPRYVAIEVGSAILMTALLFSVSRRKEANAIGIPLLAWPVMGFFLMAVVSNGWAHHHGSALIETVHLSGMVLLFFLAFYASAVQESFPLLLLRASVLAGAGIACIGLLQNFGWMEGVFFQVAPPAATMVNKNICAQYLDTIIFPAWFLVLTARSNRETWQWSAAFCLILAMILASYTRGAWLGLLAGMIVLAVYATVHSLARRDLAAVFNRAKCVATGFAIVAACVIMVLPSGVNKGTLASKFQDAWQHPETGSASFRLAVDANTWQMFKDHPWGVGLGNWKHTYPAYSRAVRVTPGFGLKTQAQHTHNDPFEFFTELGWIGGLFFIGIFLAMAWNTWKINSETGIDRRDRLLSLALLIALVDVGAHSLVSFPFHRPTSAMQIWLWLGVVGGIAWRVNKNAYARMPMSEMRWNASAMVCGLCSVFLILYNTNYIRSISLISYAYSVTSPVQNPPCEFMGSINTARKLFPYDLRIERLYAGEQFFCNHNRKHALNAILEEMRQEPFYLNNLINLMSIAYQQDKLNMVRTVAERLVRIFPWDPDGYHGLGILAWRRGDNAQARTWFMKALAQDKHYAPSLEMLKKVSASGSLKKE